MKKISVNVFSMVLWKDVCPVVMLLVLIGFTSCQRIDAGCEGLLVNRYSDDIKIVKGCVFYNVFTQEVYEYPTFVQTIDYPAFTINAKDGAEFLVDPIISLKIKDGQAAVIFRKYRKDITDIFKDPLFNHVKNVFRIQLNRLTTNEIFLMRDSLDKAIEQELVATLDREGFQLDLLTSGLVYPSCVNRVIEDQVMMNWYTMILESVSKLQMAGDGVHNHSCRTLSGCQ